MGRHSAPDDDDADASSVAVEAAGLDLSPRATGRHSSPADGQVDDQSTQLVAVVDVAPGQTHDTAVTGELPVLDDAAATKAAADERKAADKAADRAAAAEQKSAKQAARAEKKAARGETNTQADLRLVRTSSAVRAQCLGAVVVAFGLYTLVMAIIGHLGDYAVFVFIPIVVSGILIGVVLDLAHRRASRPAPASEAPPAGSSDAPTS